MPVYLGGWQGQNAVMPRNVLSETHQHAFVPGLRFAQTPATRGLVRLALSEHEASASGTSHRPFLPLADASCSD